VKVPAWRAEPNAGHLALVELERAGIPVRIITQNIDGLHQKAGSTPRKVLELHGTMFTVRCLSCGAEGTMREAVDRVEAGEADPACTMCGGILKSGTIMFGESLDAGTLRDAAQIAMACDEFWAVGTSLTVEPAASSVPGGRAVRGAADDRQREPDAVRRSCRSGRLPTNRAGTSGDGARGHPKLSRP
jgi:NAD-dependent deacetylase